MHDTCFVKIPAASQGICSVFKLFNDVLCIVIVCIDAQEDHVCVSVMDSDEVICCVTVSGFAAVDSDIK